MKGAIWDEFSEQHQHQSIKKNIYCLFSTFLVQIRYRYAYFSRAVFCIFLNTVPFLWTYWSMFFLCSNYYCDSSIIFCKYLLLDLQKWIVHFRPIGEVGLEDEYYSSSSRHSEIIIFYFRHYLIALFTSFFMQNNWRISSSTNI